MAILIEAERGTHIVLDGRRLEVGKHVGKVCADLYLFHDVLGSTRTDLDLLHLDSRRLGGDSLAQAERVSPVLA